MRTKSLAGRIIMKLKVFNDRLEEWSRKNQKMMENARAEETVAQNQIRIKAFFEESKCYR